MPEKEHGRPVRGPFIFDHVSFGVETEDDLWQLKDKLEAAGFGVSDVIDHGFIHSIYPGFPISTRSELTSFLFGLGTDDIPSASDCQACLKPPRQHIASRQFSSGTPKHLFSNPEVALHPKKENTSPIFFIWLPVCPQCASQEPGVTGLSAPGWQQTALWTLPPQPIGRQSAEHGAQFGPPS